jgi:putative GTP pyrophosphokinase
MMDDFNAEYVRLTTPLRVFGPIVEQLVKQVLKANNINFHSVTHRVKDADTTLRKINKSDSRRAIGSLTDMLGMRIITYFRDDVDEVAKIIEQEFSIDQENSIDKRAILDPDRFGYLSMHYIVKLSSGRATLAEYRAFAEINFEIQIRSILQHAWAEIEHDLGYKSEAAVPRGTRRSFSRLAGLLELADDEFTRIRDELAAQQSAVEAEIREGFRNIEIDQNSIYSYLTSSQDYQLLERRIGEFFDLYIEAASASQIGRSAAELQSVGFNSIDEIDQFLKSEFTLLSIFARLWINEDYPGAESEDEPTTQIRSGIGFYYIGIFRLAKGLVEGESLEGRLKIQMEEHLDELKSAYNEALKRAAKT